MCTQWHKQWQIQRDELSGDPLWSGDMAATMAKMCEIYNNVQNWMKGWLSGKQNCPIFWQLCLHTHFVRALP